MKVRMSFQILLVGILLLTSCNSENRIHQPQSSSTPSIDIGDGGLFSGKPCGPPCFLGIRPDLTTYQEVTKILSSSPFWNSCEAFDNTKESGYRGFDCGEVFIVDFIKSNEAVFNLGFNPTKTITIAEVIETFGNPSSVKVITLGYKEITTSMRLYFSQYTMTVALNDINGTSYIIKPTSIIHNVSYEGNSSYQEISKMTQNWSGYGEYIMR